MSPTLVQSSPITDRQAIAFPSPRDRRALSHGYQPTVGGGDGGHLPVTAERETLRRELRIQPRFGPC